MILRGLFFGSWERPWPSASLSFARSSGEIGLFMVHYPFILDWDFRFRRVSSRGRSIGGARTIATATHCKILRVDSLRFEPRSLSCSLIAPAPFQGGRRGQP